MTFTLEPIAYIRTCFTEKFGIPRQPLLVPEAKGELTLLPPYNHPDCIAGLAESSHIWLSFIFHQHLEQGWKPKVRPPRLGGNQKCGVFATRSSFRPNHLGLSVVRLDKIDINNNEVTLHLSGVDLLDGTPIVDIKPYIPYADSIPQAQNTLADTEPTLCNVEFGSKAEQFFQNESFQCKNSKTHLKELITQILTQDPRPAYHEIDTQREYKMRLYDMDVVWGCELRGGEKCIRVKNIVMRPE